MAVTLRRTYVKDGQLIVEEIENPDQVSVNKKHKLLGNGDFIFVFQKAILEVVKNGHLSKNEYKILMYLIAKTEFEKEINATLYEIAKELKLDQSNASKAMAKLEDISIVVRDKTKKTFRLNYELAFKGSPKNYKKLQYKDPPFLEQKESKQKTLFEEIKEIEGEQGNLDKVF